MFGSVLGHASVVDLDMNLVPHVFYERGFPFRKMGFQEAFTTLAATLREGS